MAEADVKAATLFGDLVERAESRGQSVYSELLVKNALDSGEYSIAQRDLDKKLSPFFTAPVGLSLQRFCATRPFEHQRNDTDDAA